MTNFTHSRKPRIRKSVCVQIYLLALERAIVLGLLRERERKFLLSGKIVVKIYGKKST